MMLALLAFLAVADTTLPEGVYGAWANPDTVTTKHEVKGVDGPELHVSTTLYQHLVVTDSSLVDTVVQEDEYLGVMAYVFSTPYHINDGRLVIETPFIEGDSLTTRTLEVDLALEADTLTLSVVGNAEEFPPQRYVRTAPTPIPPELIGTWIGGAADNAGVVVGIRLAFHENRTMTVSPDGPPLRFDMVGPYILFEEPGATLYEDGEFIGMRVGHADVQGDRLRLTGVGGDEPLYMVRESSKRR